MQTGLANDNVETSELMDVTDDLPFEQQEDFSVFSEEVATISFKKNYPMKLIYAISKVNTGAKIEEANDSYTISAPFIKVTRADVENVVGKITDGRWRMLFINREGEVREFNNYEFSIGTPQEVREDQQEKREFAQINVRIPKDLKEKMEIYRSDEYLSLSQNDFVTEALEELITQLEEEKIG